MIASWFSFYSVGWTVEGKKVLLDSAGLLPMVLRLMGEHGFDVGVEEPLKKP